MVSIYKNAKRAFLFSALSGFVLVASAQAPDSVLAALRKVHPRLLATAGDFERIAKNKETDPYLKEAFQKLYADGDSLLKQPVSQFVIPDGLRLLATSRRVVSRISTLAFLYRLTQEKRFAERAWAELLAASRFPNWNPRHFLDVGEMTYAFAIGYDWLYDYWNADQRKIIKSAIVEKGLCHALMAYEGLAVRDESWWTDVGHNWNQVCNGGIGVGALAIADEEPALASRILSFVLQKLPAAMKHFAPDGAWNEGPGYWSYATQYNVAVIAALESAVGNDFGLSATEGFSKTGLFPLYNNSPINKSFNYADGGDEHITAPQLFWFAGRFNQPAVARYVYAARPAAPLALLWYDAALLNDRRALPPDAYFRESEVATLRSRWNDSLATFVALKAGDNRANHSHLDLGSFILDALGERWILDLGADNYNVPGYFNTNNQRWTYYRTRAEGQNTVVINPGNGPDQDPSASAKITRFESKPSSAFAVMNLTPAYAVDAASVVRGIALTEGRGAVVVEDEISTKTPTDAWWFAHTKAAVTLSKDGRSATLRQNGKAYEATLLSPAAARFTVMPAAPLPTSPAPEENNPNKGVQKLSVHLPAVSQTRLVVVFHPGGKPAKTSFSAPLDQWK